MNLTPDALTLFLAYANDAGDWSGTPPVWQTSENNGHLTHLKRAKLVTTFKSNGEMWVSFTEAGRALAAEHGVQL